MAKTEDLIVVKPIGRGCYIGHKRRYPEVDMNGKPVNKKLAGAPFQLRTIDKPPSKRHPKGLHYTADQQFSAESMERVDGGVPPKKKRFQEGEVIPESKTVQHRSSPTQPDRNPPVPGAVFVNGQWLVPVAATEPTVIPEKPVKASKGKKVAKKGKGKAGK